MRTTALLFALALAGCLGASDGPWSPSPLSGDNRFLGATSPNGGRGSARPDTFRSAKSGQADAYHEFGSEQSKSRAGGPDPARPQVATSGETFTLNFVDVELQEFVRLFFDEVMSAAVVVDPNLSGRVTVRTSRAVSRNDAIRLARGVLSLHGASLVERDGIYSVGMGGGFAGDLSAPAAYRVVALAYVQGEQIRAALQAFGADPARIAILGDKLVVLAGSEPEIDRFESVIASLDVDQLLGKSFVLVPLRSAAARAVAGELNQMFGARGKDVFSAIAIERMNAILLQGSSAAAVRRGEAWLARLDQGTDEQRHVHVYPVQNRPAGEIADILQSMLSTLGGSATASALTPASAIGQGSRSSEPDFDPTTQFLDPAQPSPSGPAAGPSGALLSAVAISADPSTNSLVIIAGDEDYALIQKTVRRLDIMPVQVLIEATIAEVSLNSALNRGVRWFFETGNHGFLLSDEQGRRMGPVVPGFNYMFSVPNARLVINALEGVTNVEIISSPALTVLDNQVATLKVGDQVPVAVRASSSANDRLAPLVTEIEMRDTGIILSVKPRVNLSGVVQLDISQEISDVVSTTTSSINSPTIRQRSITSTVVVQSGTDIILGGLIAAQRETARAGVPVLKDLPLLGEVFTSKNSYARERTELIIIIKPIILSNSADVQAITQEIRQRLLR